MYTCMYLYLPLQLIRGHNNQGTELDSLDIKDVDFELYYKLSLLFCRFSMVFPFTAIYNKLYILKLPLEF